ncbi:hypothetical protein IE53DRAFT_391012 [Violaceomyces palustris]|uniref:Uncharacterized protein n=1 Tax=Violaceomyces palustris TaxID=1673888 RepID=A0ACD0NM07_9BASI|nr:hypothetical protein IE53DRAFT_391012 [Violaceomyces palustris]
MAFVHHPGSKFQQNRRQSQDGQQDQPRLSSAAATGPGGQVNPYSGQRSRIGLGPSSSSHHDRLARSNSQDWSLVFPGRVRDDEARSAASSLDTFESEQADATFTLPPLHDGTGRFGATSSERSLSVTHSDVSSRSRLSPLPRGSPGSEGYSDGLFSPTDVEADADEEEGYGTESSYFDSDDMRSVRSQSELRPRAVAERRRSRGVHQDHDRGSVGNSRTTASLQGLGASAFFERDPDMAVRSSSTWSFVRGSHFRSQRAGAQQPASSAGGASSRLGASLTSRVTRRRRQNQHPLDSVTNLPVVFTSDSDEAGSFSGCDGGERVSRAAEEEAVVDEGEEEERSFELDLAHTHLAQSAGLAPSISAAQARRPKRRHRHSAAGRSSKRSNTSQSAVERGSNMPTAASEGGLRSGGHHVEDSRQQERFRSPDARSKGVGSMAHASPSRGSRSTRLVGSLLRKVFDLEPDVLDAFLYGMGTSVDRGEEAGSDSASRRSRMLSALDDKENDRLTPLGAARGPRPLVPQIGFLDEREVVTKVREASLDRLRRSRHSAIPGRRFRMLIDGREVEDVEEEAELELELDVEEDEGDATEREEDSRYPASHHGRVDSRPMKGVSPLIDLSSRVKGEDDFDAELALIQAQVRNRRMVTSRGESLAKALARRDRKGKKASKEQETPSSVMEPTTMEALQALVGGSIPIPMPFRLLGVLARSLGWWGRSSSSVVGGGSDMHSSHQETDHPHHHHHHHHHQIQQHDHSVMASAVSSSSSSSASNDTIEGGGDSKKGNQRRMSYIAHRYLTQGPEGIEEEIPELWRGDSHPALSGGASKSTSPPRIERRRRRTYLGQT